jgi:hypothetical protein
LLRLMVISAIAVGIILTPLAHLKMIPLSAIGVKRLYKLSFN